MELLDIVDENGIPTGEVVEREKAHREGVRHRTSHVWIARKRDGRVEILLQKRSQDKDSHPGCYDISSAGHIPAGVDFIPSALRELKEELGIEVNPEELIYCGVRKGMYEDVFYGRRFVDNQISNVYLLWKNDLEIEEYTIQESEIESICFMEFEACYEAVAKKQIPNCIALMELDMLKAKF